MRVLTSSKRTDKHTQVTEMQAFAATVKYLTTTFLTVSDIDESAHFAARA
jgi:hypothetical protein